MRVVSLYVIEIYILNFNFDFLDFFETYFLKITFTPMNLLDRSFLKQFKTIRSACFIRPRALGPIQFDNNSILSK
jgi:hypothetical protein